MTLRKHFNVTGAVADQALLSMLNMAIGASFITWAPKSEYGTYTMLAALVTLSSSVQNAVISTPLTVNGSRLSGGPRLAFESSMARVNWKLAGALGALVCCSVLVWTTGKALGRTFLALGAGLGVAGVWAREYRRSVGFLNRRTAGVFIGDGVYVGVALIGIAISLAVKGGIRAEWTLAAVGTAGIVTGVSWRRRTTTQVPSDEIAPALKQAIGQVRWTLPSVGISWLQANAYVYVLAAFSGSTLVADFAAARLAVSPLALLAVGWGKIFQPAAGVRLARGDGRGVMQTAVRGTGALILIGCAYGGVLWCLSGIVPSGLIPAHYRGLGTTTILWWVYLMFTTARGVATLALMAERLFRELFLATAVATAFSLLLMASVAALNRPDLVIVAMIVGEACLGVWQWHRAHHFLVRTGRERLAGATVAWPAVGP